MCIPLHSLTGCSAVGSARVWGASGNKFESCHPDKAAKRQVLRFQLLPFFLSRCLHRYHLFLIPWACISLASSVDKLRRSPHGCMAFATRLHGIRHTVAWRSPHGCMAFATRLPHVDYLYCLQLCRRRQSASPIRRRAYNLEEIKKSNKSCAISFLFRNFAADK